VCARYVPAHEPLWGYGVACKINFTGELEADILLMVSPTGQEMKWQSNG